MSRKVVSSTPQATALRRGIQQTSRTQLQDQSQAIGALAPSLNPYVDCTLSYTIAFIAVHKAEYNWRARFLCYLQGRNLMFPYRTDDLVFLIMLITHVVTFCRSKMLSTWHHLIHCSGNGHERWSAVCVPRSSPSWRKRENIGLCSNNVSCFLCVTSRMGWKVCDDHIHQRSQRINSLKTSFTAPKETSFTKI